jgi:hypothetical protein
MAEGYAGTLQVLDATNNFWGWTAVAREIVRDDQWQEMVDVYVRDKHQLGLKRWFEAHNPHALAQNIERMLEAARQGYWQADAQTVAELKDRWRDLAQRFDRAHRQRRPSSVVSWREPLSQLIETTMYQVSQVFLLPTLALIALLFLYAFWVLGEFAVLAWRRRGGAGRPLLALHRAAAPQGLSEDELDLQAHRLLEGPRIASRVTPMLGLVATMIPMGPALKGLSDGNLARVSDNLTVAFSAVILALIAASITFWVANVRRRWLAEEMLLIAQGITAGPAGAR